MKKILFTMILATTAMNIEAQLIVDSLGRVGIGTETPNSTFAIGTSGDTLSAIYCLPNNKQYGLRISNYYLNTNKTTYGIYTNVHNYQSDCYGHRAAVLGRDTTISSQYVIGMAGYSNRAYNCIGVLGGKTSSSGRCVNYAGVYGSETTSRPTFANYSGTYAGFFKGKVRVTNGIYATVLSPSAKASPSGQSESIVLSGRGESVTDKLSQVQTMQFLRYDPTEVSATANASAPNTEELDIDNMSQEELDSLAENTEEASEQYLSAIQYGLVADQLKAVYPELVYEDKNGNVSINYVEMIPLLVQSINELSEKVAELEGKSAKKVKPESVTTDIKGNTSDIDMVRMDQNKPNPFSESTVIGLNIPEKTQKASIFIYDLSGKQIQNVPVAERGETNITVYASDLSAGMYIYTLVVDGKVTVTRRMIVEK